MTYMTLQYLEEGGTICPVHGVNSKTCKRSKKCAVSSITVGIPEALKVLANEVVFLPQKKEKP